MSEWIWLMAVRAGSQEVLHHVPLDAEPGSTRTKWAIDALFQRMPEADRIQIWRGSVIETRYRAATRF